MVAVGSTVLMLRFAVVRGGLGLLSIRRACLLSRSAHSAPQNEYRPIKKVMVANRGKTFQPSTNISLKNTAGMVPLN
ncbi:hypothetical protein GOODEAATRI_020813 [Goodea atripinnis]|uniref:Uncharacterized protein n=1 Tax=Goodea atripinnis TaxID=208336 RepID=A0ABV0NCD5_9TELE